MENGMKATEFDLGFRLSRIIENPMDKKMKREMDMDGYQYCAP